jgi:hypothetical protein
MTNLTFHYRNPEHHILGKWKRSQLVLYLNRITLHNKYWIARHPGLQAGIGREHAIATLQEFGYTKMIRFPSGTGTIPTWRGVTDVYDTAV